MIFAYFTHHGQILVLQNRIRIRILIVKAIPKLIWFLASHSIEIAVALAYIVISVAPLRMVPLKIFVVLVYTVISIAPLCVVPVVHDFMLLMMTMYRWLVLSLIFGLLKTDFSTNTTFEFNEKNISSKCDCLLILTYTKKLKMLLRFQLTKLVATKHIGIDKQFSLLMMILTAREVFYWHTFCNRT